MPTVAAVAAYLDRFAPPGTAAEWDNVGLLLGDADGPADRVLTCLTVTPEVVSEAVAEWCATDRHSSSGPVPGDQAAHVAHARRPIAAAAVAGGDRRLLAAHRVRQLPGRDQRLDLPPARADERESAAAVATGSENASSSSSSRTPTWRRCRTRCSRRGPG